MRTTKPLRSHLEYRERSDARNVEKVNFQKTANRLTINNEANNLNGLKRILKHFFFLLLIHATRCLFFPSLLWSVMSFSSFLFPLYLQVLIEEADNVFDDGR